MKKHGEENFAACCWLLERRHPELFGRPEIQLNLIQQNNTVENSLTINITQAEATAIELEAQPIREKVHEMIRQYRPVGGNGGTGIREIEVSPVLETVQEPSPITHRESDAQNPLFWQTLVRSDPQSKVMRETAVFAIRTMLAHLIGYKAHRAQINFADDPVTVGDLFDRLERLCGGGTGWQLAQKLSGYCEPTVSV